MKYGFMILFLILSCGAPEYEFDIEIEDNAYVGWIAKISNNSEADVYYNYFKQAQVLKLENGEWKVAYHLTDGNHCWTGIGKSQAMKSGKTLQFFPYENFEPGTYRVKFNVFSDGSLSKRINHPGLISKKIVIGIEK